MDFDLGHVIPVYLVIWSLVNPWYQKLSRFQVHSGDSKGSHETRRRREAARHGDEWNVWHECLWSNIPGYPSLELLSWLIPGYASLTILSQLILGYASLDILSQLTLGYPNLQNLYRDIPSYPSPDLPSLRVLLFKMSCYPCGSLLLNSGFQV